MTLQTIELLINVHSHLLDLELYFDQQANLSCSAEIQHTKEKIEVETIRLIGKECEANLTVNERCDLILFAHLIEKAGDLQSRCITDLLKTVIDTRVWA